MCGAGVGARTRRSTRGSKMPRAPMRLCIGLCTVYITAAATQEVPNATSLNAYARDDEAQALSIFEMPEPSAMMQMHDVYFKAVSKSALYPSWVHVHPRAVAVSSSASQQVIQAESDARILCHPILT